jgi:2-C-methyl-D-erythritol 2,4-cyclodiphosphate synthase
LQLGGVESPHERGLAGHSDADALLHAVIDALLGAAGRGDIGEWFPDTDPANRDCDSGDLLTEVWQQLLADGYRVVNLDCILHLQRPKLSVHKEAIRRRIAQLLAVEPERVNVKAKTGEAVGIVGREEAIVAQAVVLLTREGAAESLIPPQAGRQASAGRVGFPPARE